MMLPETEPESDINETLHRILNILVRRRWWVLLSFPAAIGATVAILSILPNRYRSEATVLVVQQQIPQRYVTPTTTTSISEALQGITEEVLSRTRLLGIINDLGLYAKQRKRLAPEQLVVLMRDEIDITPLQSNPERRDINAFKISFISENPHIAQEVTKRLTGFFIQENLRSREHQATITTKFLHDQLEVAKKKLTEQEERIRSFKTQNLGELPEQQQGNLQILSGLTAQLQNTAAALDRAQQQRAYLQSLLNRYQSLAARRAAMPGGISSVPGLSPMASAENDLARLQAERATLLTTNRPQHPDVISINQRIAQAEKVLEALKSSRKAERESAPVQAQSTASVSSEDDDSVAQVKSQLDANRLEIASLTKDDTRLKSAITQYQNRLNLTPMREQQLAGILRDYDLLKQDYADLLNKELQSQLAANLEKQQEGQQFRLVDRPSLPTVPSSPNRMKISMGGAVAGIALGLALAFLADLRDRSFHSEKDLSQQLEVPFVLGVPLLLTAVEQRVRMRKRVGEWVVGSALVLVAFAAECYELYFHR
jgi:polysaccharide biosynthesis transport protein